jgi:hypothetical protein
LMGWLRNQHMADTSRYCVVVSHNFLFSSVSVFSAFHNRNLVSFFSSVFYLRSVQTLAVKRRKRRRKRCCPSRGREASGLLASPPPWYL